MLHNQEQIFAKLTIIIYARPAYQFMFQFKQNATVANLIDELQKLYYQDIKQDGIFIDFECSRKATSSYLIAKNNDYFFNFPYQDYERELKLAFVNEKIDPTIGSNNSSKYKIKYQSIVSIQETTTNSKYKIRNALTNKFQQAKEQETNYYQQGFGNQIHQNEISISQPRRQIETTSLIRKNMTKFDIQQSPANTFDNFVSKPSDNNGKVEAFPAGDSDCCILI